MAIDVEQFRKFENLDKNIIVLAFVQLEQKYSSLEQSFRKIEQERNVLMNKFMNVSMPLQDSRQNIPHYVPPVQQPQNKVPQQKPVQGNDLSLRIPKPPPQFSSDKFPPLPPIPKS